MKWKLNFLNTQSLQDAKGGPISPVIEDESKEIPRYLDKDRSTLITEFQQLGSEEAERLSSRSMASSDENSDNWSISDGQRNRERNRYNNVLPWDKTRVKLKVENEGDNDYINASWINLLGKNYVASQAPINSTIPHFWDMILQNNIHVVVMLTEVDHGCTKYWDDDEKLRLDNDTRVVECISHEQIDHHYSLRKFLINDSYVVYHFHFNTWIDFGSPDPSASLTSFVHAVNEKNDEFNDGLCPILVHCSAGIGRTGTYLAIDSILSKGQEENQNPDLIFDLVSQMRKQRAGMVQRLEQYIYIHKELKRLYC